MPWGHNLALLSKIKESGQRLSYETQAIEHGRSRNVLVHQIESGLLQRQGAATTNFAKSLPADLEDKLPSIERIEQELESELRDHKK